VEGFSAKSKWAAEIGMAAELKPEVPVLTHFSTRYSHQEIIAKIVQDATRFGVTFPIHALLPGAMRHDILRQPPVCPGMPEVGPRLSGGPEQAQGGERGEAQDDDLKGALGETLDSSPAKGEAGEDSGDEEEIER